MRNDFPGVKFASSVSSSNKVLRHATIIAVHRLTGRFNNDATDVFLLNARKRNMEEATLIPSESRLDDVN